MIYLSMLLQGVLTFLSPCILPMLPLYFSYLGADLSTEKTDKNQSKANFIFRVLAFISGFTTLFVALGAGASHLGKFLQNNLLFLQQIFGVLVILIGLSYIFSWGDYLMLFLQQGWAKLKTQLGLKEKENTAPKFEASNNLFSSYFMGMALASSWQACLSTQLAYALLLTGQQDTLLQGVFLLLVFSLGLGLPFLLFALFFQQVQSLFVFFKKHSQKIKIFSGVLIILMGIMMITGHFSQYLAILN